MFAVLAIPLVLVILLRGIFTPSVRYEMLRTARAEEGDMTVTISGKGVVIPNYEEVIGAPFASRILRVNHHPGDKVKPDDTLMVLDNEAIFNQLSRLENELKLMEIRKSRQETELLEAREDFKIDRQIMDLNIEGLQSDFENERQMNHIGGAAKESVVKAETSLRIAQLEREKAILKHENDQRKRQSSLQETITEISIQHALINEARLLLEQAFVRSPFEGDLGMINDNPGVTVQKGQEIARVADYARYKLRGTVSNAWTGQLASGQFVIIKDKEQTLEGSIESISPEVENGMLNFVIRIEDGDISRIRPNQQLEIRVVVAYKAQALRIPNGSYYHGSGYKDMYVIHETKAHRRKVLFGEANFDLVEILEGLEEGDEMILDDLSEKFKREELKIKY